MAKYKKVLTAIAIVAATFLSACAEEQTTFSLQIEQHHLWQTEETQQTQVTLSDLPAAVQQFGVGDILNSHKLQAFEQQGYTVEMQNLQAVDNNRANFDLIIKDSEGKVILTQNIPALLKYNFWDNKVYNLDVYWGTVNIGNNEIVLTTLDRIYIFDTKTCMWKDHLSAPSSYLEENYYFVDTLISDKKYFISYIADDRQGILECDSLEVLQDHVFKEDKNSALLGAYTRDIQASENISLYIRRLTHSVFIDKDNNIIGFTSGYPEYNYLEVAYDISQDVSRDVELRRVYNDQATGKDFYIIYCHVPHGTENQNPYEFYAISAEKGEILDSFVFDGSELNSGFLYTEMTQEDMGEHYVYDKSADTLTITNDYVGQELVIDFKNHTSEATYTLSEEQVRTEIAKSRDGKYILYGSSRTGGGDVAYTSVVLYDKQNDTYMFIDEVGGMYGGNESVGFFTNGDVYVFGRDDFKVYTADSTVSQPVFKVSDNFPLGEDIDGNGTARYLLDARRDPEDGTYIVLYTEIEPYETYSEIHMEDNENVLKSTYKVGLLDAEGYLVTSYDTTEHVLWSGFYETEMRLQSNRYLIVNVLYKGNSSVLQFRVDINTGEFKNLSGGYDSFVNNSENTN